RLIPVPRPRLGLTDLQSPAGELTSVELRDRLVGVLGAAHLHEGKPSRTAGLAIGHHLDLEDLPGLAEDVAELELVRVERKVSDEQTGAHFSASLSRVRSTGLPSQKPRAWRSTGFRSQAAETNLRRRGAKPRSVTDGTRMKGSRSRPPPQSNHPPRADKSGRARDAPPSRAGQARGAWIGAVVVRDAGRQTVSSAAVFWPKSRPAPKNLSPRLMKTSPRAGYTQPTIASLRQRSASSTLP